MMTFFKKLSATLVVAALVMPVTLSAPALAGDSGLIREAQSQRILTVRDRHSGAYLGELLAIETGYGFNSDCNLRGFAAVDRHGNLTVVEGGCSNSVLGDVLRNGIPAAVDAFGAVEAAKALGDRQIRAARATAPDVTNVTATGGSASAEGGNALAVSDSYSASHGGEMYQFQVQSQTQMTEVEVKSFIRTVVNNETNLQNFIGCRPMKWRGHSVRKSGC
jgi:hypothetical protein